MWNQAEALERRYQDTQNRILKLCLTDGKQSCYALEYQPIPKLSLLNTHPGTKVLVSFVPLHRVQIKVSNVLVRRGLLLLKPASVEVLGGGVEDLIEKYNQVRKQSVRRFFFFLGIH